MQHSVIHVYDSVWVESCLGNLAIAHYLRLSQSWSQKKVIFLTFIKTTLNAFISSSVVKAIFSFDKV